MASVIFYQNKEKNGKTLILITFTFNNMRLRLSTGLYIPAIAWDKQDQKAKPIKEYAEFNKRIRDISNFLLDKYDESFPKGIKLSKEDVKKKSNEILESFQVFTGESGQIDHLIPEQTDHL